MIKLPVPALTEDAAVGGVSPFFLLGHLKIVVPLIVLSISV
jgi:hypothetical protein